jgi:Protein kinase domain
MTPDFSPPAGDLAPGDRVASYQIEEQIGTGGMAVVFRALDLRLDRQVALKVLAPRLAEDEAFRLRFIRESRAAAGVDHPHIIPIFEAGEASGVLFIAMRYVAFGDVRMLIETEGRLATGRVTSITTQVASALDAAHAHGLIHRDVKPGNMLLAATGGNGTDHVYLSDFGLSKHSLATSTLTATGQFMGTLDYVSPEQIQGQPADGRADQYALACTVIEMLSGAPPFKRDDSMALLWAQLEAPPPDLRQRRPDLPVAVSDVVRTALAKSPADRYPSCLAFASALRAAFGAEPPRQRGPQTALAGLAPQSAPAPPQPARPEPARPAAAVQTRADPVPVMVDPQLPPPIDAGAERTPTARVIPARDTPNGMGTGLPRADRPPPPSRRPGPGTRPLPGDRVRPPGARPVAAPARPRRRGRMLAGIVGVVVAGGLAFAGYKLLHKTSPAGISSPAATSIPAPAAGGGGSPAATVRAYFAAINAGNYQQAWQLVGKRGPSYQAFANGFAGTSHDTVTILSTSGDVVDARLRAAQTNGAVKVYQGTYTVAGGVITSSNVQQVSG